ncbi:MAG: helix-turn-helix domain-containing protein [Anaerolineales bacterium]|nr:helix-turn-helix domain-containing protein [Anaerolineales bacterium]
MTETVGPLLRAARESQGRSLEDAEAVLHIRARHLAALEADDYAALPSLAQARGFLKNYAQYLGLDLQDTLALYAATALRPTPRKPAAPAADLPAGAATEPGRKRAEASPNQVGVRAANRPRPAPGPARPAQSTLVRPRRRWLSADLLVAAVFLLGLGALLVWGARELAASLVPAPTPTGLGQAATLPAVGPTGTPPTATPTATVTPEATPTVDLPTPAGPLTGVNVTVRAEQRIWVSVSVDGQVAYAGLMPPGEAREFTGQSVIEVTTGNGLGTRVIWNGTDQGVLGQLGEVVTRLWTLEGEVIPTPTATPTATLASDPAL